MTVLKKLRYNTISRRIGNSLFVLIPTLVQRYMGLNRHDQITIVYDHRLKKITIRKIRG